MVDNSGNMSIDFLVGFTIFILAFIWVATMIPGLLIGLSAHGIDYDAVAYRTAVILAEDPGAVIQGEDNPWEQQTASGKDNIARFGLALTKDTPNILSRQKVDRLFSADFVYPDDYREKLIFGDYPYHFNISLLEDGKTEPLYLKNSEPLPMNHSYGFIRREVMIKGHANATLDKSDYADFKLYNNYSAMGAWDVNASTHDFAIQINRTELLWGNVTEPPLNPSLNDAYRIDPRKDWIIINLTNLSGDTKPPVPNWLIKSPTIFVDTIQLQRINLSRTKDEKSQPEEMLGYNMDFLYVNDTKVTTLPVDVMDKDISFMFSPGFFGGEARDNYGSIYINCTFYVNANCTGCIPSRSTTGFPFLNTSIVQPWQYNYNKTYTTQSQLTDAVLEVAVW